MSSRNSAIACLCFVFVTTLSISGCTNQVKNPLVAVGVVTATTGFPTVSRNNQTYILADQSQIYITDIFDTDADSRVEITLTDNSMVALGPDSHLVLHESQAGELLTTTLTRGAMYVNLEANVTLRLRTPMANVRQQSGTSFARLSRNTLDVCLISGEELKVSNDNGRIDIDSGGHGTSVIAGSAPQAAFAWSPRRVEQALAMTRATLIQ